MRFPKKSWISLLLALALLAALPVSGVCAGGILTRNASGVLNRAIAVDPTGHSEGFSAVLYNNTNGLPTSEANAIAETSEGFIWIGSYAGLIRYDGNTFERVDSTTGISSVVCLYVDSRDRLWIGTNDSGVFLMEKGEFRRWDKSNGLKAVNVRAIAEDTQGLIYVGTTEGISVVDTDLTVSPMTDDRLAGAYIRDIRLGPDGLLYGLTQIGDLFALKDGEVTTYLSHDECRVDGIIGILPDPKHPGYLYLSTESSQVYQGSLERNFGAMGVKDIAPLTYVERFEYIDGQIWICAGNGIGNLDDEGFHATAALV